MMKLAGIEVGRIGLGTNRLTRTAVNVAFIKAGVGAGVQLIDTAHLYTGGQSEETIGSALGPAPDNTTPRTQRQSREFAGTPSQVVVATKGGFGGAGRGRPEVLRTEIEESLRRLRTDHITLYYLHRVDPDTLLETSLAVIKEYVDRGVIRYVGVSQVNVEQVERARKVVPIAAVQNQYNLSQRGHDAVVDYCEREGIVFVPFYPLRDGGGGSALKEIADRHRTTPAQVMLAWLLRRSPVMLPIPGTLSLAHLKENLEASKIQLTDREFEALS
jgi:pyridoxine 4-dehydrogenase